MVCGWIMWSRGPLWVADLLAMVSHGSDQSGPLRWSCPRWPSRQALEEGGKFWGTGSCLSPPSAQVRPSGLWAVAGTVCGDLCSAPFPPALPGYHYICLRNEANQPLCLPALLIHRCLRLHPWMTTRVSHGGWGRAGQAGWGQGHHQGLGVAGTGGSKWVVNRI